VIIISGLALAFETPLEDPDGNLMTFLKNFNYCTSLIFAVEIIIKVIAEGLICNGSKSYLRSANNWLDFLVVVASTVSLIDHIDGLGFIKIMRLIKLLRPFRLISRNENLSHSM
jgi:voltage-dependent calcium channel L type alpha-1D